MSDHLHRIAVIRKDGLQHHTDTRGWAAETVCIQLFREAQTRKDTICVVWFEGEDEKHLSPRQIHGVS